MDKISCYAKLHIPLGRGIMTRKQHTPRSIVNTFQMKGQPIKASTYLEAARTLHRASGGGVTELRNRLQKGVLGGKLEWYEEGAEKFLRPKMKRKPVQINSRESVNA
jgi:hypothetical protein